MHPRRIPENTYKGFKGSQQDTSGGVVCQRDASKGAGDAVFPCAHETPSEHLLIQQNTYFGVSHRLYVCYNSCSSKEALDACVKLQVTNSNASFSNLKSLPFLFSPAHPSKKPYV